VLQEHTITLQQLLSSVLIVQQDLYVQVQEQFSHKNVQRDNTQPRELLHANIVLLGITVRTQVSQMSRCKILSVLRELFA